ncbi:MAG: sensor histidine kinase [Aestuariivirga sp.]|uniref:sensor histidine kinase n=1 Tax=Aestuariivirga sp. TaxID=2650926 RepID=UPI0038D1A640
MLAALVAGIAFACLLTAAAALHAAASLFGAALLGGLMLAGLLLALGWGLIQRLRRPPQSEKPASESAREQPSSSRNAASLELLEAVAREVMTAAGTIKGFAQVLAPGPAASLPGGERRDASGFVLANSRDLLAFAAGLHDYARFERGRLRITEQQVDAAELVESALALCQEEAEASDRIIVARLVDGAEIRVDAERIRQTIAGLVHWALAESGAGGILDVSLQKLADGGLAVDIGSRAEASGPAGQTQLFEPRLEADGLRSFALPIAKRVALLHSGEVVASSAPGRGASARLTLPASRVMWPDAANNHNAQAA